jgi:hypothetical protein
MVFSKNRELASLRQHGFPDEKNFDFLNAFFLRRGKSDSNSLCLIFIFKAKISLLNLYFFSGKKVKQKNAVVLPFFLQQKKGNQKSAALTETG